MRKPRTIGLIDGADVINEVLRYVIFFLVVVEERGPFVALVRFL